MATKNIVPRLNGEGEIGTASPLRKWSKVNTIVVTADAASLGDVTLSGQLYNSGEDKSLVTTTPVTIDWNDGMVQEMTLSSSGPAFTVTASFANVKPYASYQLIKRVGQPNMEISFGDSIFWPGGAPAPTFSNTSGSTDIITFVTDGASNIYAVAQFNFSASVG